LRRGGPGQLRLNVDRLRHHVFPRTALRNAFNAAV
jgi:hypothetical protein